MAIQRDGRVTFGSSEPDEDNYDELSDGNDEEAGDPPMELAPQGPMNLGPKDELIPVRRDTLESLLVVISMDVRGDDWTSVATLIGKGKVRRMNLERARLRAILKNGRDVRP